MVDGLFYAQPTSSDLISPLASPAAIILFPAIPIQCAGLWP